MKSGWLAASAVLASGLALAEDKLAFSPPYYPSPWVSGQGGWEDAYSKARQFVSKLTLDEKVNLTTGVGWMSEHCVGQTGEIPRVGFHSLCLQDGPLGIRMADYITAFPAGINVGATWSKNLAYLRGKAIGEENRDKGVDITLGPAIGPLGRSPDGGRNWEGFGSDPVLQGNMVAEGIKGIQDAGVIACAKHYILNEQEHFRQAPESQGYAYNISESLSSNVDDITMHEMYLWPFADAVRAGVGSVMCSYTQINNSYGCSNSYTQNKLLKGELGFQGLIMSDWQAQHSGVGDALAGLDMTMPGDTLFQTTATYWGTNLTIAVVNGTVPQWRIDDMAVRVMAAYYKVGRDKHRVPINFNSWTKAEFGYQHNSPQEGYGRVNQRVYVREGHARVARTVASASVVLLKNSGGLPLTGREKFTAVIGEDAGPNFWGPNGCDNRGCINGTLAMAYGSGTAEFPYLVTPATAIQNKIISEGYGNVEEIFHNNATTQIITAAMQSAVSLVFANSDAGEGFIDIDGSTGDRKNLTLWKGGDKLIKTVASHCNNTIVVMHTVGPVMVNEWNENPNVTAIVWAGLPGQESGNALADVLYGRVNPGGKTPFTWAKAAKDYGVSVLDKPNNGHGAPQANFDEGIFIDYRHFDKKNIEPVYEFGFGLSYTKFEFSNLRVEKLRSKPYQPTTGYSKPAPTFGNISTDYSDYLFPKGLHRVRMYIYPWLNSTDPKDSANDANYGMPIEDYVPKGATNGSAQPLLPASGGPGGHPGLYDKLYKVSAVIRNSGKAIGDEVPQAYVSLGGPKDAKIVLRGFDRITLRPGERTVWSTYLTRRDVSNWDPATQNWVITKYPKTVYVGNSSRKLPLKAKLPSH